MDEEKLKLLKEKIAKSNKYVMYVNYPDLLDLVKIIEKYQEQIKNLKDENDFLRFMYKGTEEYKAVERYASGDHIPRID